MHWANDLICCQKSLRDVQRSSAGGASKEAVKAAVDLMYHANRLYAGLAKDAKAGTMATSMQRAASPPQL